MRLPAIILAAGEGRRVGGPKALLDLGGKTMLARTLEGCHEGGFCPCVAVVPPSLIEAIRRPQADLVLGSNPSPESGPLASLRIGMELLPADVCGLLLVMVDFALVSRATYARLGESIRRDPNRLWRPVQGDRHGHPVWFPRSLFEALRAAPLDQGARSVVYANEHLWAGVEVDDPWIFRDVDTPQDLRDAQSEASRRT